METNAQYLDRLTQPAWICEEEGNGVRCLACAHQCLILPGKRGVCKMRTNSDGVLHSPWGYVAAMNADPIEKKPFMHFLPGSLALTFGMLGCNFHCDFCQNWVSSQTLRDPASASALRYIKEIQPEGVVTAAERAGAKVIASSYNEPLITTEWAIDIFKIAQEKGMRCAYVSNGFATERVLKALQPTLDGLKIDLKCFSDEHYRALGGRLEQVRHTIQFAHDLGIWVEVVSLIIPDFNDSTQELWQMAEFVRSVSADIPWHVTAFYPTYHHISVGRTPPETLQLAAEIGQEAGLQYVYAGNLPGRVGSLENTYCPHCQSLLVKRWGYRVEENRVTDENTCPQCGHTVAGVWH